MYILITLAELTAKCCMFLIIYLQIPVRGMIFSFLSPNNTPIRSRPDSNWSNLPRIFYKTIGYVELHVFIPNQQKEKGVETYVHEGLMLQVDFRSHSVWGLQNNNAYNPKGIPRLLINGTAASRRENFSALVQSAVARSGRIRCNAMDPPNPKNSLNEASYRCTWYRSCM